MKMSKLSSALLATGLMAAAATATAGVSGNVAFTTDYLFRGVSQSSENAAIQGTLSYGFDSGFYLTAWGSSVSNANPAGGLELDTLAGYSGKAGEVGYDVGVMRYNYPGATDPLAYDEVYGSVSYKGAKLGLNYSNDYYGGTGKFLYSFLEYGTEVGGVGLFAHVGLNKFDEDALSVYDGYVDYKVAVSKTLNDVGFELAYVGSDIDEADCAAFSGDSAGACEGRVVGTVSKSF